MLQPRRPLPLLVLLAGLSACNAWQDRAEFAAPQSRWKATEPGAAAANAPPPAVPAQYCYRTLATVDCFTETQPSRVTGYTGTYPKPE
ncbi:MAG TPA: hypothetical protein VMU06_16110 [Stellaceae bacterium]|nr:hypothetical protein [Stellaceae bacterium]